MALPYVPESFTEEERKILRPYVTNLDGPVFALVNLPEVVKGALFARYSRSSKSLRRLFLDEFVDDLDISGDATIDAAVGLRRAEDLYERVFAEYGDDSVAQLGGVHLACEQASNVLTKILERPRLLSYLEQSTRYLGYDARLATGLYRYHRPSGILDSPLGARYVGEMDRMFDTYGTLLPVVEGWLATRYPRQREDSDVVHRRAVRAKALDALRGLLPAASVSNLGIFGSGQSYELLLLHLRSHPLPEARAYGALMLAELRKVIPSFLQRVDREERGVAWSRYLADTREATAAEVARLWPPAALDQAADPAGEEGPSVRLLDFDPDGEEKVLRAACFPHASCSERELTARVRALGHTARAALLAAYTGERANRRHRPGRAFERTEYRFEIVADYGAFRDLQRHRMLTVEWQALSPALGYDVPSVVEEAGQAAAYRESMDRSAALHHDLAGTHPVEATYAVALGYRIRFVLQLNAREAMHLIELRSGPQGHPSYRHVAQLMHRAIRDVAGHRALAATMTHVDHDDPGLERLDAERRVDARRGARR